MVIIWMLLLTLLLPSVSLAAPALSERDWQILKNIARNGGAAGITLGTEQPLTCTPGTGPNAFFLDTDTGILSFCSATDTFLAISTGQIVTLDGAFDNGKIIDGAGNLANAVRIGDGTTYLCIFTDATLGPRIKPCTDANIRTYIENGFTWGLYDIEGDADMFVVTPNAATKLLMYQYKANYRPLKSVFLSAYSLQGDGTNCPARPTVVTISNMPYPTFICSENNSSRLKFAIPMRPNWDGGVVYFKPYYSQTAADTGSVLLDSAAACRALGTAFNGTYGTEVNIDDAALVGSGAIEGTLSGAITPNGTCAASDWLYGYLDVDATTNPTTAAATLNFIGVEIFWSETSWSH